MLKKSYAGNKESSTAEDAEEDQDLEPQRTRRGTKNHKENARWFTAEDAKDAKGQGLSFLNLCAPLCSSWFKVLTPRAESQEPPPLFAVYNFFMDDELKEMQEHAERVSHDSSLLSISLSAAVLAVLVASATLLGHRAHTEELLLQSQSSDLWAEYQAKSIRQATYESLSSVMGVTQTDDHARTQKLVQDFHDKSVHYEQDKKELGKKASELQAEQRKEQHRGNRLDLSEALLEMALVITSITLMTKKRRFWYFGMFMGAVGVMTAVLAMLAT